MKIKVKPQHYRTSTIEIGHSRHGGNDPDTVNKKHQQHSIEGVAVLTCSEFEEYADNDWPGFATEVMEAAIAQEIGSVEMLEPEIDVPGIYGFKGEIFAPFRLEAVEAEGW